MRTQSINRPERRSDWPDGGVGCAMCLTIRLLKTTPHYKCTRIKREHQDTSPIYVEWLLPISDGGHVQQVRLPCPLSCLSKCARRRTLSLIRMFGGLSVLCIKGHRWPSRDPRAGDQDSRSALVRGGMIRASCTSDRTMYGVLLPRASSALYEIAVRLP